MSSRNEKWTFHFAGLPRPFYPILLKIVKYSQRISYDLYFSVRFDRLDARVSESEYIIVYVML